MIYSKLFAMTWGFETVTHLLFKEADNVENDEDICEVDGCRNKAENKIVWEKRNQPSQESMVCRAHHTINEVLNANHSRFASVMTIDNIRMLLMRDDVI